MRSNYDFKQDLKEEQKRRPAIVKELYNRYPSIRDIKEYQGDKSHGDLTLVSPQGTEFGLEYKEDFMHWKTGNVAIELESWGRLTGILVTQSPLWLSICYNDANATVEKADFLFVKSEMLKKFCTESRYDRYRKYKSGIGEGGKATVMLFRLTDLKLLKQKEPR